MKLKSYGDNRQQCRSGWRVVPIRRCKDFRRRLATIMLLGLWLLSAAPPLGAQEAAPTWVEAWRVKTEGRSEQGAAVTEDRVYVAAGSDLLALDAADGSVIWTAETGRTYTLKPIVNDDAVFVANNDGTITRFRTEDGTASW